MKKKQVSSSSYDKIKAALLSIIVLLPTVFYIIMEADNVFDLVKGVILVIIIIALVILYRAFEPTSTERGGT